MTYLTLESHLALVHSRSHTNRPETLRKFDMILQSNTFYLSFDLKFDTYSI
jgi:hypothetical protein